MIHISGTAVFIRPDDECLMRLKAQIAGFSLEKGRGLFHRAGRTSLSVWDTVAFGVRQQNHTRGYEAVRVHRISSGSDADGDGAASGHVPQADVMIAGLKGTVMRQEKNYGFIKPDSAASERLIKEFPTLDLKANRGIFFDPRATANSSQGLASKLQDVVHYDVIRGVPGDCRAINVRLVRTEVDAADIEAFLAEMPTGAPVHQLLLRLVEPANAQRCGAILNSEAITDTQVQRILLLVALLASTQIQMKQAQQEFFAMFQETRFLRDRLPHFLAAMARKGVVAVDFLNHVATLCVKVLALGVSTCTVDSITTITMWLERLVSQQNDSPAVAPVITILKAIQSGELPENRGTDSRDDSLQAPPAALFLQHEELTDPFAFQCASIPIMDRTFDTVDQYISAMYHLLRADCYYHFFWSFRHKLNIGTRQPHCPLTESDLQWGSVLHSRIRIAAVSSSPYQSGLLYIAHIPDPIPRTALQFGNLVCLCTATDSNADLFWLCIVDNRHALRSRGYVGLKLLAGDPDAMYTKVRRNLLENKPTFLVESRIFFIGYQPVLRAVAAFHSTAPEPRSLPFAKELLSTPGQTSPAAPAYTLRDPEGFARRLQSVCSTYDLDPSQQDAVELLQRSLVLVQGPPGTGKSFVGARMLEVIAGTRQAIVEAGPTAAKTADMDRQL